MRALLQMAYGLSPVAAAVWFACLWQGVLLTVAVALALRAIPGVPPAARAWLWMAVGGLIVALPGLAVVIPHTAITSRAGVHMAPAWSLALLAVWAVLSCVNACSLCTSAMRLWKVARRARPVAVSQTIAGLLAQPRKAILCVSEDVDRPGLAGFFRPRILLPRGLLETLSAVELQHVVLHEREHLRRWDDWLNLLQQISLVLLPLHPALLWLNRRLGEERELACDDGVLALSQARRGYAASLVRLAEASLVGHGISLALGALGSSVEAVARESELVGRVRRILAGPERIASRKQLGWMMSAVCVAVLALTAMLARSPQWVSFDSSTALLASAEEPSRSVARQVPAEMLRVRAPVTSGPVWTRAVLQGPPATPGRRSRACGERPVEHRRLMRVNATLPSGLPRNGMRLQAAFDAAESGPHTLHTATPKAAPAARVVVTGFEVSQHVYAAVPWRDGWLILQL